MKIKLYRLNFCRMCLVALLSLSASGLLAQVRTQNPDGTIDVTGMVSDASGDIVIGATVTEKGTRHKAHTNGRGVFNIKVKPDASLVFSCVGFETKEVPVGNQTKIDITLVESTEAIDEVVVVGYGTQKKATVTGSVSAIKGDDIVTTKNENVLNMLTGKVPGLRIVQNSSEPGQFKNEIDIRGFGAPLVIIDGIERGNIQRLDAEDIESISVLKDASAAIYGVKAGNGVLLVTTKQGTKGRAQVSYSGNVTWQRPSNFPDLVNATEWMTLFNEKLAHNVDGPSTRYTQADFDEYLNGTKQTTNWKDAVFRKSAPQTQHTLSVSGGNSSVTYYASMGYQNQDSFLKSNAINYEKYTMRSNVSAKINKNLKFDINLAGHIDTRKGTPHGSYDIVRAMWLMRPIDPIWNNEELGQYAAPEFNDTLLNPVAAMDADLTGTRNEKSKWFQSSASLTYNIPHVEGLSLKALYSYDFIMNDNKAFMKSYLLYKSDKDGNPQAPKVWNRINEKPYDLTRYYYGKDHSLWNIRANYERKFGKHSVTGLVLFENKHNVGDNFRGNRQVMLPVQEIFAGESSNQKIEQDAGAGALYDYSTRSVVGRATYDYANKYMIEGAFRYDASSRFIENKQWGFFPSVSGGWRISEESFWKKSPLKVVNDFKIRSSYGLMGLDNSLNYQFLTGYNYPSSDGSASTMPKGYIFDNNFYSSSNDKGLANRAITWYDIKMFNIGFDAEALNGMIGVTAEYFRRKQEGLLASKDTSLPGIVGVGLPQENLNSDLYRGFEIEISHRHHFGDFYYNVRGNIAYTRRKQLFVEMAEKGNSYLNWRSNVNNRDEGIWWGHGTAGRFENWDQIYYNSTFIGRGTVPGDYRYEDWNGDGMIDDLDLHPLTTNHTRPLINYGLMINGMWKGLDFSMLWQGAAKRHTSYGEFLMQPLWSNTNAVSDFMDRWHPVDPAASPYDPTTEWAQGYYAYSGTIANANSKFNMQNAGYLRLKNVEIGYTLPKKWLNAVNIQDVRFYVSGYNLLTFTKMRDMDPEFPSSSYGYNYPLNKTYTIGCNVKF